ncbi:MAG: RNA 2',3'-cyclic phosphodiesterase [Acidobacteria bacterium]|nr:RNA 2',3'-cyclic phosphodiesterase [Acidobacteriota bacterium]
MRLFVGLELPQEVKDNLNRLLERLRPAAGLRWGSVENLHITTKFVGEWPEERLEELKAGLGKVNGHSPIPIEIRGLGWFPNPHNPRVFWAAVRAPESLAALAKATEEVTVALGVARETRPYSPHLTLARIQETANLAELRRRVASLESDEFGQFTAAEFHLYQSQLMPGGSVYTRLATFPLK